MCLHASVFPEPVSPLETQRGRKTKIRCQSYLGLCCVCFYTLSLSLLFHVLMFLMYSYIFHNDEQ